MVGDDREIDVLELAQAAHHGNAKKPRTLALGIDDSKEVNLGLAACEGGDLRELSAADDHDPLQALFACRLQQLKILCPRFAKELQRHTKILDHQAAFLAEAFGCQVISISLAGRRLDLHEAFANRAT